MLQAHKKAQIAGQACMRVRAPMMAPPSSCSRECAAIAPLPAHLLVPLLDVHALKLMARQRLPDPHALVPPARGHLGPWVQVKETHAAHVMAGVLAVSNVPLAMPVQG